MKNAPVIVEKTFNATIDQVWDAITSKEAMQEWYFPISDFVPEPGFAFEFTVEHEGRQWRHLCRVTEVVVRKKLQYTWQYAGYDGTSYVTWELFDEGGRTRLKLTHEGIETIGPNFPYKPSDHLEGWNAIIGEHLAKFVEAKKS